MTNDQQVQEQPEIIDEAPAAAVELDDAEPAEVAAEPSPDELLRQKDERVAELEEQVKRVSAEFQNFRRRQEEEQKRQRLFMKEEVFRSLLPILDNLERALQASKGQSDADALIKGVELVDRDVRKIFEEHGVEPIEALDQLFDPALHQAVMMEERDDVPDQTIVAELQRGYKIQERVLRPSMVKVARND